MTEQPAKTIEVIVPFGTTNYSDDEDVPDEAVVRYAAKLQEVLDAEFPDHEVMVVLQRPYESDQLSTITVGGCDSDDKSFVINKIRHLKKQLMEDLK